MWDPCHPFLGEGPRVPRGPNRGDGGGDRGDGVPFRGGGVTAETPLLRTYDISGCNGDRGLYMCMYSARL